MKALHELRRVMDGLILLSVLASLYWCTSIPIIISISRCFFLAGAPRLSAIQFLGFYLQASIFSRISILLTLLMLAACRRTWMVFLTARMVNWRLWSKNLTWFQIGTSPMQFTSSETAAFWILASRMSIDGDSRSYGKRLKFIYRGCIWDFPKRGEGGTTSECES